MNISKNSPEVRKSGSPEVLRDLRDINYVGFMCGYKKAALRASEIVTALRERSEHLSAVEQKLPLAQSKPRSPRTSGLPDFRTSGLPRNSP